MKLVVARGAERGKEFILEEGSNLIGRWDPDTGAFPEVDLENEDEEAKVSRKHAMIERKGKQATIVDIGSLNGTYLNRSDRLEENKPHTLKDGDEVIIGKVVLTFYTE